MLSLMREGEGDPGLTLALDFDFGCLGLRLRFVEGEYEGRGRSSNVSKGVEKRSGEGQRAWYSVESSASEESDMHSSCVAPVACRT